MRRDIHWIQQPAPRRLAIMARPRAGDWLADEIAKWRAAGIDVVVSLLEPSEITELDLQGEAALCQACGIEFLCFPIPDRGVPESLHAGQAVAIHCRAGIGRSAPIAACVLLYGGADPATVFDRISEARGVTVPDTESQRDWLARFATSRAP